MAKSFYELTAYGLKEVMDLVNSKASESQYLEFKSSGAMAKDPTVKEEIGKDISAFANADGGILIYGINEKDGHADSLSFIDSKAFSIEWLQQVMDSQIQRRIPDVSIHTIENPKNRSEVIYLMKIPSSSVAAHMTSNKNQYFKRRGAINALMEEFEVRELYNRTGRTQMEICDVHGFDGYEIMAAGYNQQRFESIDFNLLFFVRNTSHSIEHNYKFEFRFPQQLMSRPPQEAKKYKIWHHDRVIYAKANDEPIFQGDIVPIADIILKVNYNNYEFFKNGSLSLKLYYTNGIIEKEYKLSETLKFKGNPISDLYFK